MKKYLSILLLIFYSSIIPAEIHAETGPTFVAELTSWEGLDPDFTNGQAYLITYRTKNNYEIGVIGLTSQMYSYCCGYYTVIPQNYGIRVAKILEMRNFQIGGGINYWSKTSIIFSQKQTFEFVVGYKITEYARINFRHYSNGNQTLPNIGLNLIAIELSF